MLGLVRSTLLLVAALFVAVGVTAAPAADRKITLLPGTDLPGFDYSVVKGTTLDACQSTCAADRACHAFTFNQKAHWCFLKSDVGPATPFAAATSGKLGGSPDEVAATRLAELPFPAQDMVDAARTFAAGLPKSDPPPAKAAYADLIAAGDEAVARFNPAGAMTSYRQALAIARTDPAVWLKLANVALGHADAQKKKGDTESEVADLAGVAASAALEAFLQSEAPAERASALGALAHALELREMWRESIATYRSSVALVDDPATQQRLDKVVAQHGFRVASNSVDAEAATPRICIEFSDPLPDAKTDLSAYVVVDGAPQVAVETEQSQICLTGVEHGKRYSIKLRAGLPSADGESLRSDVDLNLYVPDRKPFVGFANNAYVLPAGLGGGLPISSVNAKSADLVIYRIGDRSIAATIRNDIFAGTLDGSTAENIANQYGEKSWEGQVDLAQGKPNEESVTAIPIADVLPKLQPGAYVVTAKVTSAAQADYWDPIATQWFIVTDLGLTTVSGDDGVHGFVRSLTTAKPVAGAHVRLVARNNEILGEAVSDADGRADFAPGLARGDGGRAPLMLVAETDGGDYAFLDVSKAAFDLTDRGVDGRPSPGPLDLFATTERGVYRPGETVFLTALLRDAHAKAVAGLPLTMELERPDGVVAKRDVLKEGGAGGYFVALPLLKDAMRGSWHVKLYADPKAQPLSNVNFLVEDFEPDRLAFDVTAPEGPMKPGEETAVTIAAKYLYGATAPNLAIEGDAILRPKRALEAYPGYTFGRLDDDIQTDQQSLGTVGTTDEKGDATASVTLPEPQATTRPLEAEIVLRLVDTNGRTVEHSFTRPVMAAGDRIGIKPRFDADAGLAQGSQASFDVIAVAPTGATVAKAGLDWTLSKVDTNYQWYRDGGTWKWEAVTTTHKVASGTVDAVAGGPVTVAAGVQAGRYQLEVDSSGDNPTSTSYEFYAGYYYPSVGSDTPDKLKVALDKPSYRTGDTAHLRLDPQFAGTALVMVVADRIISMKAVDVAAGGATVDLPVTDDWSPGAYITATLYRPASAAEKRMPARALGLAFAGVDPGNLKLDVGLEAPKETLPRQAFTTRIKLGNLAAGQKAYVAVAAVDLGILNLTSFKTPDPDGWYFGQRQLGVELRDLYGKLIDPTQGSPGAVRSGGDGGPEARLGTPPATSVLVALDSGIVEVGADGMATVSFDMPDFNGTVRLMAMAWTGSAVGHASADVIVHDPVVVNLSPPRFLRLGDTSRLLVEINNVSGPAGTYKVKLDTGQGLSTDAADASVDLVAGGRKTLTPSLTGAAIGDQKLTLTVTAPDGTAQVKELTLGVRAASIARTTSELIPLAPGASVTLDKSRFAELVPHSSSLTLAVGPIARLDVPALLAELDRYPYGCAEQVSSRALPLLYLNDVAKTLGMGTDDALKQRIKDAIVNLVSKQTYSGGFGLWGPSDGGTDLWLDAYVTEFLLRAKKQGYDVPVEAMNMALDNLGNQVSSAADFDNGGEDIAYALYDMARGGRAAIGDLRYYFEARLNNFGSPLAKAQLGAALALYGDRTRAATAFAAAIDGLKASDDPRHYRSDYGSRLRDAAGILALAAEFTPSGVDVAALASRLGDLRDLARYTSTQEDAWTLVAAAALAREAGNGSVTIDGAALAGQVYRHFDQEHFDTAPVVITNSGNQATEAKVSVTGIPARPPAASSQGFTIKREYFLPDGSKFDPAADAVHQNDRFVVVLSMTATTLGSGQYVVADPLPAGFEIENPDLSQSGETSGLSWLKVDVPTHVEARTDQYIAAFRYASDTPSFSTAYMVRATSPGTFVLPGATVEDMYRPDLRANTAAGALEVKLPAP
jgi:alpha-2-macroglobulin